MKHNREYEIAFIGLKPGEHEYQYHIEDKFFEQLLTEGRIEKPDFRNADLDVKMILDKKSGTMLLKFFINGKCIIPCDRCGDDYDLLLWDEFELLVKIVDDETVDKMNRDDAEVAYIGRSDSLLDVSGWLYEFITLCVPIQHVHGEDEEGNSLCNPEALKFLQNPESVPGNSIWEQLKKNKLS